MVNLEELSQNTAQQFKVLQPPVYLLFQGLYTSHITIFYIAIFLFKQLMYNKISFYLVITFGTSLNAIVANLHGK